MRSDLCEARRSAGRVATATAGPDISVRTHIECLIDDAAHRLADIALRFGDPDTARWACYQAHKVVPGCEQCYLRRFYVAYLDRNPAELRSAMSELQQIIRVDDGFNVSTAISKSYELLLDFYVKAELLFKTRLPQSCVCAKVLVELNL